MAIVREFTYEQAEDDNFIGLKPNWFDNADPTTGRGAAHDMLEHFRTQVGPVEGEMEALGAFVAIRMEQGAVPVIVRTDVEILADDIRSVLVDMVEERLQIPSRKTSRRLHDTYEWADSTIQSAVSLGMRRAKDELESMGVEQCTYSPVLTEELQETLLAWVRQGYRRALKRYAGVDLYRLGNSFFKQIEKCLDALTRSETLDVGDTVRIALHPHDFKIGVRVNGNCAYERGYI